MVYLEYPAYVEVDCRSRLFSLYKWFKKLLISRTRLSRIPRLCRSIFKVPCPISPRLSRSAVTFPVCLPHLAYSNHAFTPAAIETNDNCRPVVHVFEITMFEISGVFKIIYIGKTAGTDSRLRHKRGIRDKPCSRYRYFTVFKLRMSKETTFTCL